MCQEKGAVVRGGASQRSGNPNTHNQKIENRATEGYSSATCSVTSDGRARGSKDDGGEAGVALEKGQDLRGREGRARHSHPMPRVSGECRVPCCAYSMGGAETGKIGGC